MARLAAVSVAILALAGCGQKERVNAHQSTNVDRSPAEVYAMPNFFNNVASKCDGHGHRIFVTSNKANAPSILAVISDASCPGASG
jgi:outer membrane murein-binding lipoprotein Lpp